MFGLATGGRLPGSLDTSADTVNPEITSEVISKGKGLNGLADIVTAGPSAPDEEPSQLHGTPASLNGKK